MINVAKSPVYAYRSSAVIATADAPTGSSFDDWLSKVQKKLDQTIREAISHVGEGPTVKPHWSVKVIGIAEAGVTIYKVFLDTDLQGTAEQLVGTDVINFINFDQGFGFQTLPTAEEKAAQVRQRQQFEAFVAGITTTASDAGISNVVPVWIADPRAPARHA